MTIRWPDITEIISLNPNTGNRPFLPRPRPLSPVSHCVIMGNIFSHADQNDASTHSSTSLKRNSSTTPAAASNLKQSITQNMRLSKSKVTSLLKANHLHYSIVHRNHFYNTLPHVTSSHPPTPQPQPATAGVLWGRSLSLIM